MSNVTAITQNQPDMGAIEQVLINGNLTQLNVNQRVSYYNHLCESLGLNPLTKPFEYLTLNGKLVLYARKDCTEQLRKLHGVSITQVRTERFEDVFVVTATGQDKTGRTDSSTGAVTVGNLKGDALANAIMKAETKAKRRLTLSICGLGFLDETEIETIPDTSKQPWIPPKEEFVVQCEECANPIQSLSRHGEIIVTYEKVLESGREKYDRDLCGPCQIKLAKKAKDEIIPPSLEEIGGEQTATGTVTESFAMKKGFAVKMGNFMLTTFHKSMYEALKTAKGKCCVFIYSQNGEYNNIEDIRKIGEVEYRDCLPVTVTTSTEAQLIITNEDIPF